MANANLEIICAECGADTLLVREPDYDGFKKVGEILKCASCGHRYESEEVVPFKQSGGTPRVCADDDAPAKVEVFGKDEADRLCRYCAHYIVNPFVQKCGRHFKLVEATDSCADFEKKQESEDEGAE